MLLLSIIYMHEVTTHYSQHSIHIPPMRLPRGSGPAPASMVHWSPRVQLVTTQTTHTSKQLLVFTKFPLLRFFCNDIGSQIIIYMEQTDNFDNSNENRNMRDIR